MIDPNYLAYAGMAALLVISPGATMVVVADGAIDGGRKAGLWTVAGVGTANFSLAMASAFGLSALFHRFPEVLHVLAVCGALYMAWLGIRALRRALVGAGRAGGARSTPDAGDSRSGQAREAGAAGGAGAAGHSGAVRAVGAEPSHVSVASRFGRGLLTNYTNVSVVLFYTVVVPQFITSHDSFLARYLLLGNTHVAMSIVWLTAFALFVGSLADRMTQPRVRRTMDALTGCALLAFALKIALSA